MIILGLLLYVAVRYFAGEIKFMKQKQALLYDLAHTGHVRQTANDKAARWQSISEQINSGEVTQWKIAIMDADILLDEVLSEQGFAGETVGEKLQDARSHPDLGTVEYAAEAHGVRNKIAHHGDFDLSARQAKATIAMYERFFNELYHL